MKTRSFAHIVVQFKSIDMYFLAVDVETSLAPKKLSLLLLILQWKGKQEKGVHKTDGLGKEKMEGKGQLLSGDWKRQEDRFWRFHCLSMSHIHGSQKHSGMVYDG